MVFISIDRYSMPKDLFKDLISTFGDFVELSFFIDIYSTGKI